MKHTIAITAAFLLVMSEGISQSGWTQEQGNGFFKLSENIIRAGSFFNPDGEVIDITTTSVYGTTLYAEYGFAPRLTGILNANLFVRSTINELESSVDGVVVPGDEFNGFGDVLLALKYGIVTNKTYVVSASGSLKLPTGENVGGNSELLQSGDGAWGFTGLVSASRSFYPTPLYASLYLGYQWRGETDLEYSTGTETVNYDDAFVWGAELGWTPDEQWQVAFKIRHVIALENGTGGGITGGSSIFGNSISYFSITPEVSYILANNLGFSLSIGTAAFAQNILAAPNFNIGVLYILR